MVGITSKKREIEHRERCGEDRNKRFKQRGDGKTGVKEETWGGTASRVFEVLYGNLLQYKLI